MSAEILIVPVIAWKAIVALAAVAAVKKTSDNKRLQQEQELKLELSKIKTVEIPLEDKLFLKEPLRRDEEFSLAVKDGIKITFYRTVGGKHKIIVTGKKNEAELIKIGKETFSNLTQSYIKEKVLNELKKKGFSINKEEVQDDKSIRLVVRKWS